MRMAATTNLMNSILFCWHKNQKCRNHVFKEWSTQMSQKFKSIPVSAAVLKSMVRFHEFFWFSRFFWREVCCWSLDGLYSTETRGVWRPVCSLSMYVDGLIENARAMWWSKSPSWKAPSKVSFTHLMSTKGAREKVRLRYLKTSCSG